MPDGPEVHRFQFQVIKLADIEAEDLHGLGLKAVLPLMPLARSGKRHEVVEAAIAELAPPGEKPDAELLAFTLEFASLVFKDETGREWLKRSFRMFHDILRETWVSQELIQEGEEKGIKKGIEQGIKQATQQELQRQRETIVDIVLERFPKIVHLAQQQVERIDDPSILRHLIIKMSTVQTAEEAKQRLLELGQDSTK